MKPPAGGVKSQEVDVIGAPSWPLETIGPPSTKRRSVMHPRKTAFVAECLTLPFERVSGSAKQGQTPRGLTLQ